MRRLTTAGGTLLLLAALVAGGAWAWRDRHYGAAVTAGTDEVPTSTRSLSGGDRVAVGTVDRHQALVQWYDGRWRGWTEPVEVWSGDDWVTAIDVRVIGEGLVDVRLGTATSLRATTEEEFAEHRYWCLDRRCQEVGAWGTSFDDRLAWHWESGTRIEVYRGEGVDWIEVALPPASGVLASRFLLADDGSMAALAPAGSDPRTCRLALWWSPTLDQPLAAAAESPAYALPDGARDCADLLSVGMRGERDGIPDVLIAHAPSGRRVEFSRSGDTWEASLG